jgi:hypothetical protein
VVTHMLAPRRLFEQGTVPTGHTELGPGAGVEAGARVEAAAGVDAAAGVTRSIWP